MAATRVIRELLRLLDVNVPSPSDGYGLAYDSASGKFVQRLFAATSGAAFTGNVTNTGSYYADNGGAFVTRNAGIYKSISANSYLALGAGFPIKWTSSDALGSADVGLTRDSAGVLRVSDGGTGLGGLTVAGITFSGAVMPNGTWLNSAEGNNRFYFTTGSLTYIKGLNGAIFRDYDDSVVFGMRPWGAVVRNLASHPATTEPGQFYFNTTDGHFYGWNGSAWKQLDN